MATFDPLTSYARNEPCWCRSGAKYKACHGAGPRWPPGADLPTEPPSDGIWIAPDVTLSSKAVDDLTRQMSGAPIWAPSDRPQQRPLTIHALSERLAQAPQYPQELSLAQIGVMRSDGLDALGLGSDDEELLDRRLTEISERDHDDLIALVFTTTKATLDRLRFDAELALPPTSLWTPNADPRRTAGQTLLWADRYLVSDGLAAELLRRPTREDAPRLVSALASEMRLRSMLETGGVALVPEEAVATIVAEAAYTATESDLKREDLVKWVEGELRVEGPTRREAIFLRARDDDEEAFYFYGHIDEVNDDRTVSTTTLADRYDPSRDYAPWIAQSRRQTAATLIQQMNFDVATADVFAGHVLALTPFRGRLLARKQAQAPTVQPLAWASVPLLPDADAGTLARIVAEDETVEALRTAVRRSFAAAGSPQGRQAGQDFATYLEEEADVLRRSIQSENRWKLAVPTVLTAGSIAISALIGDPLAAIPGALGALAALAPVRADHAARRRNPAFAVLIAERAMASTKG